jgi:AraC-like DNA-binding protein
MAPAVAAPAHQPGGQSYRERLPAPAVAGLLSIVWVQRVAPDAAPYTHRTVPNGSIELSAEIGSLPRVVGPQTGPLIETVAPGVTVVGVRFHPGLAPSVLGVPASELVDLSLDWDALWRRSAVKLGEEIAAAASPEQAAAILERAVFDLLPDAGAPDPVVTEAVRRLLPWAATDVGSITSSLHISERQFRRKTVAAIGFAPKTLQRMLRFQGFLALAHDHEAEGADLALLAADTGYADQPHLTRESLRLSGITPRALLKEAEENCVGLHDHAASRVPLLRTRASRLAA